MAVTLQAATVILFSLYFTTTEASPTQIRKTLIDPSRCDSTLEDQNLPHESDCSKYYRCVYGKKVPKICPEKMLFNTGIGNCDLYYNVECHSEKMPPENSHNAENLKEAIEHLTGNTFIHKKKAETTQQNEEEKNTFEGRNTATMTKQSDTTTTKFVYVPHESDQMAYYKIENGESNLLYCEEGMFFSIELEICAKPWVFE